MTERRCPAAQPGGISEESDQVALRRAMKLPPRFEGTSGGRGKRLKLGEEFFHRTDLGRLVINDLLSELKHIGMLPVL